MERKSLIDLHRILHFCTYFQEDSFNTIHWKSGAIYFEKVLRRKHCLITMVTVFAIVAMILMALHRISNKSPLGLYL